MLVATVLTKGGGRLRHHSVQVGMGAYTRVAQNRGVGAYAEEYSSKLSNNW